VALIDIGVSGLRVQQTALSVTGQNITNASTPGYSRQRVEVVPQNAGTEGSRFRGAGARVTDIARLTDQYVVSQVRSDESLRSELSTLAEQISAIDGVVFADNGGLDAEFGRFFSALNDANASPASTPQRQLLLEAADSLSSRFASLNDQLNSALRGAGEQMRSEVSQLNELAEGVAALNRRIAQLNGETLSGATNQLLDQRDELLRAMSQAVALKVVPQNDGTVSVFVGKGQPLVLGSGSASLAVGPNQTLLLQGDNGQRLEVTDAITGGTLGASLKFAGGVLTDTQQRLGQLAQNFAVRFNEVHERGLNLEGEVGQPFFADINSPDNIRGRVSRDDLQGGPSGIVRVEVSDPAAVPLSDYRLDFSELGNGTFSVRRLSDQALVMQGRYAGSEQTLAFDGLEVTLESGDFLAGQQYRLSPLRQGANDLALAVTAVGEIALGSPAVTTTSLSNSGSGELRVLEVNDIQNPLFAGDPLAANGLRPPLLLSFTAPDRFDVLDNSDPTAPAQLDPPIRSQRYAPGLSQSLNLGQPGSTRVYGDRNGAGDPVPTEVVGSVDASLGNGYASQLLQIADGSGDPLKTQTVTLQAGASAAASAERLDRLDGVAATAVTDAFLEDLSLGPNDAGPDLYLAGVVFEDVESLESLATRINQNPDAEQAGLRAVVEGDRLRVTQVAGQDLNIQVTGPRGSGLFVSNGDDARVALDGGGGGTPATLAGTRDLRAGVDFSAGGPYTLNVTASGASAQVILDENFQTADEIAFEIEAQLTAALGPNRVQVGIDGNGALTFTTTATGSGANLLLTPGGSVGTALGLATTAASGADEYQTTTVGGQLSLLLDEGLALTAEPGGPFANLPSVFAGDLGLTVALTGRPQAGDQFSIDFTSQGILDNRTGTELAALQDEALVGDPPGTVSEAFAALVQNVGAVASQTAVDLEAAESLLAQSEARLASISGVNLDEEAANLIRHEQAYNASAQVISVARDIFNTLFNAVS
jgi:flagellar hook-associated protein 1 FlgK